MCVLLGFSQNFRAIPIMNHYCVVHDKRMVSRKIFKPITLVFDLLDMTKTCVKFLAIFVWTFKITTNLRITATLELGGTQNFKTARYFIKYHGINT